jgi:tripartite-type tricarboxylate transporter receptor subunit TctC
MTRNRTKTRPGAALGLALALAGTVAACSSDGGQAGTPAKEDKEAATKAPYAGKDLEFVVPYEPGGGYDAYARALAPYIGKCLDARVVVRNEPGAGGLRATNKTAVSPGDGNRIQIVNTVGLVSAEVAKTEGPQFKVADLAWVGRVSSPPNVLVVGKDSAIKGFGDIVTATQPVRYVAQGPGANDYIAPYVLSEAIGHPYKIITGFAGSGEARAAVISGNADAHVLPIDSQLSAIKSGDVRPVVTIAKEPDPLLPDTPSIYETDLPTEAKETIDQLVAMGETGRGVIAPPKIDDERLEALRAAFQCAVEDEALLAELEKQKRPLNVLSGKETEDLVAQVLDAPESFRTLIEQSSS